MRKVENGKIKIKNLPPFHKFRVSKEKIMNKYWFRPRKGLKSKDVGWGFIPISWKGVLMYVALFVLVIFTAFYFNLSSATTIEGFGFLAMLIVLLVSFSLIARKKTKGLEE